jgi:hypothetical protein
MFLGLLGPDMDPDPSIINENLRQNLDSYWFVTFFYFLSLKKDVNVPSKSNKQNDLDPYRYQNVTDSQHCKKDRYGS